MCDDSNVLFTSLEGLACYILHWLVGVSSVHIIIISVCSGIKRIPTTLSNLGQDPENDNEIVQKLYTKRDYLIYLTPSLQEQQPVSLPERIVKHHVNKGQ